MLDAPVRAVIDPILDRAGRMLAVQGFSANGLTLTGLCVSLACAGAIAAGWFATALLLLALGRLLDGLDGAIARAMQPTAFGGYLDIVCDFVFYAAVPLAFVIHDPVANGLAGAVLLFAFTINGTGFLAYAAVAAQHPQRAGPSHAGKAFFFSAGLTEGTETIAAFVAMLLFPGWFAPIAGVFAVLCLVTAGQRLVRAGRAF